MSQKMQFSVCLNVYGKDDPTQFRMAVDSVRNQTVQPDQIVLVVDGPIPQALDMVVREYESCADFKVIRLAENQGLGNARRIGLAACSYPLVAMMDADDLSVSDRFEKQLAAFQEDPTISVAGGQIAEFIDHPQNVVGIRQVPLEDGQIKAFMKKRSPMNHVTVMLKLADIMQVGGYLDWPYHEDYYLWLRMALANMRFANIPEVLVRVRVGADMYRRRGGWKYFVTEQKLQKYMLNNKIIGLPTYIMNIAKRFVVQVMLPNRVRSWAFQRFARTRAQGREK